MAIFLYIIAILSIGAYVSRYFFIKSQKKLQSNLKLLESELKALRTQINPHYLSNSLISLQNSILEGKHDKSLEFIGLFNKVMRNILTNSEKSMNTIQNELKIIQEYLNLENLNREQDIKLLINGPIDSNYLLETIYIPTNILQPIIENSIIHGFSESLKKDLFISININIFETQLKIEIIDNGIGYHPLKTDRKSYGLKNIGMVLKNLENKYKQSTNFKIVNRNDNNGTQVTIELPLLTK
jgi:LytS/YehU family sensor histidine kinase